MNPQYQCGLCGWVVPDFAKPPEKCPECSCTKFREVFEGEPLDRPSAESVAHLKKKVENCWNYTYDKDGSKKYHPLKLQRVVDKTKATSKDGVVAIQERCEECGQLYSQQIIPLSRVDVLKKEGIDI